MSRQAFADLEGRHRLLEGFLSRVAAHADPDAFALRGGMLVRHWFPEVGRPARDVDLVCRLPYDEAGVRERLGSILAGPGGDGVEFEAERFRIDLLWPRSRHPGMRLFAAGRVDGWNAEMSADLTFHLDVWPDATVDSVSTAAGPVDLWVCRPAMLLGRKIQVLAELGPRHWRPKDLADVWLMLRHRPPATGVLGEAIERSYDGYESRSRPLRELVRSASWWRGPRAGARWRRFAIPIPGVPDDLATVVDEVRARLAPFAGRRVGARAPGAPASPHDTPSFSGT